LARFRITLISIANISKTEQDIGKQSETKFQSTTYVAHDDTIW